MTLETLIAYICKTYPRPDDLSKARLNKIIYLADWKACLTKGEQISSISWKYNHYGPYVEDVITEVRKSAILFCVEKATIFGTPKEVITCTADYEITLGEPAGSTIDEVIADTANMNWSSFIDLVYSTYPIVTQPKHSQLNLKALAKQYVAEEHKA